MPFTIPAAPSDIMVRNVLSLNVSADSRNLFAFGDFLYNFASSEFTRLSTNGATTRITNASTGMPNGLKFATGFNSRIHVGTENGDFAYSDDGVTWTTSMSTGRFIALLANNGSIGLAAALNTDTFVWEIWRTTNDGVSWSQVNITVLPELAETNGAFGYLISGDLFYYLSNIAVWTSPDGETWTESYTSPSTTAMCDTGGGYAVGSSSGSIQFLDTSFAELNSIQLQFAGEGSRVDQIISVGSDLYCAADSPAVVLGENPSALVRLPGGPSMQGVTSFDDEIYFIDNSNGIYKTLSG